MFIPMWVSLIVIVFIVVSFALLIYIVRLLKHSIHDINKISNKISSLEISNNKKIPMFDNKTRLTKEEFATLSGNKVIDVVNFISISFISIYLIDAIPNLIDKYKIIGLQKDAAFILRDIIGSVILFFLISYGFIISMRIKNLIKDVTRKPKIAFQNFLCSFCICALLFFNAFILLRVILPDIINHPGNPIALFIVLCSILGILSVQYICKSII